MELKVPDHLARWVLELVAWTKKAAEIAEGIPAAEVNIYISVPQNERRGDMAMYVAFVRSVLLAYHGEGLQQIKINMSINQPERSITMGVVGLEGADDQKLATLGVEKV